MKPTKFLWLDLETTGLNPDTELICEVGARLTNEELRSYFTSEFVIHRPDWAFQDCNDFVRKMHTDSGLIRECGRSQTTLIEAECQILNLIECYADPKEPVYLAGNSIHFDRSFIRIYMPGLHERLHYRMLDVSVLKICAQVYDPAAEYVKEGDKPHRALADLLHSIAEFQHYRSHFGLDAGL